MAFTQVDQWTGPIATVQAVVVAPTGKIIGVAVWWTDQPNWVPVPASGIPVGAALSVSVQWRNNSAYRVTGQVVATLITPSGQRVALTMGSPQVRDPAGEINAQSGTVTLSAAGAYSLEASLNLEAA